MSRPTRPIPFPGARGGSGRIGRTGIGQLILVDEGEWGLLSESGDNEPVWDLAGKVFRPGDYVTLRRPDHAELVFRIVNVETE